MKTELLLIFSILQFLNGENIHLETAINKLLNQEDQLHIHFMTPLEDFPSDNFFKIGHENLNSISIGVVLQKRIQLVVIFNPEDYLVIKNVDEFYLIVSTVPLNVSSIFSSIWNRRNLLNVNAIAAKDEKIELLTFFPFSDDHCNNTKTIKIVNEFADGLWKTKSFFPKKISNFHGCPLRLEFAPTYPAFMKHDHQNGTVEYSGSDFEIVLELAKRLNFVNKIKHEGIWGGVFDNGSTVGLFSRLRCRETDYGAGWYFISRTRIKYFDFTQPHFFVPFIVIVSPGN